VRIDILNVTQYQLSYIHIGAIAHYFKM